MNNDLDLPPFTSIPTDVRDRLRHKVQERIRRPRSYRRPLAVAAAVTLLAAAAMFVVNKGSGRSEPAGPTRTDTTLDRCWAAIHASGAQTTDYPDRSTWQVSVVDDMAPNLDVVAAGISAGGKKFFCEATTTTVSVSWPLAQLHYAPGTRTALMMLTPNGTVAGVMDPSWPAAWFSDPGRTQVHKLPQDGMFVFNVQRSLVNSEILTRPAEKIFGPSDNTDYSGVELPKPPTLGVSLQDRPSPPQERTSAGGKALGDCLAHVSELVMDPDTYGAGALVAKDGATLVMALSDSRLAACARMPVAGSQDLFTFTPGPSLTDTDEAVAYYSGPVNFAHGARSTLGGIVPPDIVKAEIRFANGTTVGCEIANRTFALVIPDEVEVPGDNKPRGPLSARLFTASGAVVREGPLTIWNPN